LSVGTREVARSNAASSSPKRLGNAIFFADILRLIAILGLPGIEWVIGEIIAREKLVDSGLSAL
jgi:hypothetical protein